MPGLKILTDTSVQPVSVALFKQYMRVDPDDTTHDTVITLLLQSACEMLELRTARSFIQRTYREYYDCFPGGVPAPLLLSLLGTNSYEAMGVFHRHHPWHFELSRSPLVSVAQIQYLDQNGATQTVDPSVYVVNSATDQMQAPATISLARSATQQQVWPVPLWQVNSVWIDYIAGYSTDDSLVPARAKQAVCLLGNHWYDNPDSVQSGQHAEIPLVVSSLINQLRIYYQA